MSRSIGALTVAVLAALLALTGCSAGDDDAAATPVEGGWDATRGPDEELLSVEAEPGAPLVLTEAEEAFLVRVEVPPGVYEGAVLEAGYEACVRIGGTASVDEDALRDALASGEIADAEAAIGTLCPEYERFLPAN